MKYYERDINYYETDQMAVVHHSNYIRFFEEARVSFMDQVGYPYERLENEEILSPVLAVSCKYLYAIRFGDRIRIGVRLTSMSRVKCKFSYEITDAATGEIRAKGTSEHGFITKDGKPVVLPKEKPEFYNAFLSEMESDKNSGDAEAEEEKK